MLALQGDFEAHRKALAEIGVESFEAKRPADLDRADGLIIPGGESTTLWKFFEAEPWEEAIRNLAEKGRPILGTCAGAIVLAREVTNPPQRGLGLIDIAVARNAYGRQVDSFLGEVDAPASRRRDAGRLHPRAPHPEDRPGRRDPGDATAASRSLVREGNVAAATFHPELTSDRRLHRLLFAPTGGARERRTGDRLNARSRSVEMLKCRRGR